MKVEWNQNELRCVQYLMGTDTGIYTTQELKADGASAYDIAKRVNPTDLTDIRPGWYATQNADPAILTAVSAGGVATCVTALDYYKRSGLKLWLPDNSHYCVHTRLSKRGLEAAAGLPTWMKVCRPYGRPLPTTDAVDTLPYALNAAARCLPNDEWIAVCDSVIHNTSWTIPDLQAHMATVPQRLRNLMAQCDDESESGPESLARVRLRAEGFTVNVQPVIGRRRKRGDLRIGRLLIECDSDYHDGEARRNDIMRDRKTLRQGWITVRIDAREIMYTWAEPLDDIRAIIEFQTWHIRQGGPLPDWID